MTNEMYKEIRVQRWQEYVLDTANTDETILGFAQFMDDPRSEAVQGIPFEASFISND